MPRLTRRRFITLSALAQLGLAGCRGGFPTICGYRLGAGALYDQDITSVYVPLFHNRAFQTTPYRGFEDDITKAVVDEIGRTTTFRIVSDPERADTELIGVLTRIDKRLMNRTQQNMVREGELAVTVDVLWRDLRTGVILSSPKKFRPAGAPVGPAVLPGDPPPVPFDPSVPVPPAPSDPSQPTPVSLTAIGRYIPELGESNASAMQRVQNRLAVQIVSMMEKGW